MDGQALSVSPSELYTCLGRAAAPLVFDVRRGDAFEQADTLIIGAVRRSPDDVEQWASDISFGRPVVAYCVHGHEVSQGVALSLQRAGIRAAYLDGGIAGWQDAGLPTRKKLGSIENKWVTRERPKIDRIACPWLISRFINPFAEFLYVPLEEVAATAKETGATAYDVKNVHFGHVGDRCTFDAIIRTFEIRDQALDHLANIVRGADTSRPDLALQCEGLLAISYGLSANYPSDHEMLKHGMVIYDALYRWCRSQHAPT